MDERAQGQAIIDKITGVPNERLPHSSALDEPWRSVFRRVRRCGDQEEGELLIALATHGLEDRYAVAKALVALLPPDEDFRGYPSLEEIAGRFPEVGWLWPSWIPRGMLTILGAEPGAGKSLVALDLARRVIHGEPFPDGALSGGGGAKPRGGSKVLMVDAEGAPALLRQRAEAWGIDSQRLFLMLAPTGGGLIDLTHSVQQRRLLKMCQRLEPTLVVIDSLAAATAGSEGSLDGARAILGFLSAVARQGNLAMLVIHHLRKRARSVRRATRGRVAADDLRGSSHISAAARSVMALSVLGKGPEPGVPTAVLEDGPGPSPRREGRVSRFGGPRRLEIVKTNLCRHPQPLMVTLEGDGVAVPTLRYSEYVEPLPEPSETDLCARWILAYLGAADEPVKPAEVVRAAQEEGYSRIMVYRARRSLGELVVDVGRNRQDPRKRWRLGE